MAISIYVRLVKAGQFLDHLSAVLQDEVRIERCYLSVAVGVTGQLLMLLFEAIDYAVDDLRIDRPRVAECAVSQYLDVQL